MLNIGILASTKASDMQAIIDAIAAKKLNARISVVISDREDAYALERAKKHSINAVFINPNAKDILKEEDRGKRRELFDKKLSEELEKNNVDLILAIGYMKIISPWLVGKCRNRIMNIHPSLLPKFAGGMDRDVHQAVLDAKEKSTGCTLHFVDESVEQNYEIDSDGSITKKLTISYKNPQPPSDCNLERGNLCLNGILRNWFRIYVPKGSIMIDSKGSEVKMKTTTDLGKTVFEGFLTVRPQGATTFTISYKLPFKLSGSTLPVLIQKQPGTYDNEYVIKVNGGQVDKFKLLTDKELIIKR